MTAVRNFATGGVAMNMRNVVFDLWQRTVTSFRWAAAPLPRGKAGQFSMANSHGRAMARESKQQDAAWKLLSFLGGKEGQAMSVRILSGLPSYRSVAEKEFLPDPAMADVKRAILTTLAQGKSFPNTLKMSEALDLINPMLAQMFNGQVPARQAVTQLRPQIDALLASA